MSNHCNSIMVCNLIWFLLLTWLLFNITVINTYLTDMSQVVLYYHCALLFHICSIDAFYTNILYIFRTKSAMSRPQDTLDNLFLRHHHNFVSAIVKQCQWEGIVSWAVIYGRIMPCWKYSTLYAEVKISLHNHLDVYFDKRQHNIYSSMSLHP